MKGHIMRIGYLRVQDNSESKNVHTEIVEKLNVEKAFVEKNDQENDESPQLMKALEYLRTGDVFVVKEFAEIASSMAELLSIVRKLAQKQIGFVSLKEKIDTSLPGGGAVMNVFTAISQFDYDMKKERQRKGIELARSEGKYKGRKAIEVDEERFELLYNAWQAGKSTPKIMMNELNLKPATFWRKVKGYREKHGITEDVTSRKHTR